MTARHWIATALVTASVTAGAPVARAEDPTQTGTRLAGCLTAASTAYHVPLSVLLILLQVEGGSLGGISRNSNDTVDIGPMQVNSIWVSKIATHWHALPTTTFEALRDSFCANVEAGTWILRQNLDAAHGDFWEGVGLYHSHAPAYKAAYLRKVLQVALRLQKISQEP